MKHLSMYNDTVPSAVAKTFVCPYTPGDQFISELKRVDCKSCLKQVKKAKVPA